MLKMVNLIITPSAAASSVDFSSPVKWVGLRQRFFNSYLIAKDNFSSGKMNWEVPPNEKKIIAQSTADMKVRYQSRSNGKCEFQYFLWSC